MSSDFETPFKGVLQPEPGKWMKTNRVRENKLFHIPEKTFFVGEKMGKTLFRVLRAEDFCEGNLWDKDIPRQRFNVDEDTEKMFWITEFASKLFKDLCEQYHISVEANFVEGKYKGKYCVFGICERVCQSFEEKQEKEELQKVILGIAHYYNDILSHYSSENKEFPPFLFDVGKKAQYVFGTTRLDPNPQMRLVDIDPQYVATDEQYMYRAIYLFLEGMLEEINYALSQEAGVSVYNLLETYQNISEQHLTEESRIKAQGLLKRYSYLQRYAKKRE